MAKRAVPCPCGIAALALLTTSAETARAMDAAMDATMDAQLYQVTDPYGAPPLRRRRYVQTLTLRLADIQGARDPGGPTLDAVARVRMDADIGQDPAERAPGRPDRFVPGLSDTPVDIMTAYVEGRNYFGGLFGFRLGRQLVMDPLGFWAFDGGLVRLTTPAYFAVEAYGGFEQRAGVPLLGTSRYEADGVFRGSRDNMPGDLWPQYLRESALAPAWGVAAESTGVSWLTTRVSYRRVENRDVVVDSPFADANGRYAEYSGSRVSSERVGWSANAVAPNVGALRSHTVFDLSPSNSGSWGLRPRATQYGASLDAFLLPSLDVGADWDYFLPTFDGDSIWSWFRTGGTTNLTGRVRWDAARQVTTSTTFGARRFDASTSGGAAWDVLGSVTGIYRYGEGNVTARVTDEQGQRGHVRGVDLSTLRRFSDGLYDTTALVSLYDWADPLRPDRDATSFTYVLGAGHRPFPKTRVGVEWEHSMNGLVGQRYRVLATLAVTVY